MNIALFANTGLGNEVLKKLLEIKEHSLIVVVTRKLEGRFPYYNEQELYELCEEKRLNVLTNVKVNQPKFINYLRNLNIDLIIVSSFSQIIKDDLIKLPSKGIINFHPSLLPKYKGPNPMNWVILNGEEYTGVTVHKLVKEIDAGDILMQRRYKIKPTESLGELFRGLAKLSGTMVEEVLQKMSSDKVNFVPQNTTLGSYYKRPFENNYVDMNSDLDIFIKRLRAFVPFPGLNFLYNNKRFVITEFKVVENTKDLQQGINHNKEDHIFSINHAAFKAILKY